MVKTDRGTKTLEADNIIIAVGAKPLTEITEAIKGKVKEFYLIGDCAGGKRIADAIRMGYEIGQQI